MKFILLFTLMSCLLFSSPGFSAAYQWVDEKGITHFSQTPPDNGAYDIIDMDEKYPSGQNQIPAPPRSAPDTAPKEQPSLDITEPSKADKETCEALANEINHLKTLPRIRLKSGGTYTRLSDAEKWAMIEEREQWYEQHCK